MDALWILAIGMFVVLDPQRPLTSGAEALNLRSVVVHMAECALEMRDKIHSAISTRVPPLGKGAFPKPNRFWPFRLSDDHEKSCSNEGRGIEMVLRGWILPGHTPSCS
jgi:hypothetical protein